MDIEVSQHSTASPEAVWAVMIDVDASPRVISAIADLERLDGGDGFVVGTRWRETRTMFGKQASEVLEVTAIDEQARTYRVEADNDGTHYVSDMGVRADGSGSLLTMTFGAEQAGGGLRKLVERTVSRAFEGATRKALQKDLADIAAEAENR